MITGTEIGLLEILIFFVISHRLKIIPVLNEMNNIIYYWCMLTILTGIWEFSFITHYKYVNSLSRKLIETNTHVWSSNYDISYILPWKLSYIFYAEYGAYADREYMITKDDWSRVIEGSHAIFCAIFCLLSILFKLKKNNYRYIICLSVGMGSQLMNSILYLVNYFIECDNPTNVNYNTKMFPTGILLSKRLFMYVNVFWFVMPSYTIIHLLLNKYY